MGNVRVEFESVLKTVLDAFGYALKLRRTHTYPSVATRTAEKKLQFFWEIGISGLISKIKILSLSNLEK